MAAAGGGCKPIPANGRADELLKFIMLFPPPITLLLPAVARSAAWREEKRLAAISSEEQELLRLRLAP